MPLTKQQLYELSETELQRDVLIPLFRAMGYKDVTLHQGAGELGKDVVMWRSGELGERVNYAVVAKATKITGEAKGTNSSASNVCFQIEQAFNNPYSDPITSQTQAIERCFVVSNKEILPTAIQSIKGVLESRNYNKVTRFINGDELWILIEQFLGERTVWEKLTQVMTMFDEADPYYRLISNLQSGKITLSLEAKDPEKAKEHPVNFTHHLKFPDTPEGQAKREEYINFIDTGSPMTIPKEFIERVEIPEFLRKFLEPMLNVDFQISSGSQPDPSRVLIVKIEMKCDDGEISTLDYIALVPVQSGRKQVILSNQFQRVPWRVKLTLKPESRIINFEVALDQDGVNVKQMLDGWRFLKAASKPGTLRIEHLDTGFSILEQRNESQELELPLPFWFELLEKIVFIQSKTHVPIIFPSRNLGHEEMNNIFQTAAILREGKVIADSVTMTGVRELGKIILDHFASGQPLYLQSRRDESVEILDVTIPLGTVVSTIHNGYLPDEDIAALKKQVEESASEEDIVTICFKSYPDRPIIAEYQSWLPNAETSIPSHNQEDAQ